MVSRVRSRARSVCGVLGAFAFNSSQAPLSGSLTIVGLYAGRGRQASQLEKTQGSTGQTRYRWALRMVSRGSGWGGDSPKRDRSLGPVSVSDGSRASRSGSTLSTRVLSLAVRGQARLLTVVLFGGAFLFVRAVLGLKTLATSACVAPRASSPRTRRSRVTVRSPASILATRD